MIKEIIKKLENAALTNVNVELSSFECGYIVSHFIKNNMQLQCANNFIDEILNASSITKEKMIKLN